MFGYSGAGQELTGVCIKCPVIVYITKPGLWWPVRRQAVANRLRPQTI